MNVARVTYTRRHQFLITWDLGELMESDSQLKTSACCNIINRVATYFLYVSIQCIKMIDKNTYNKSKVSEQRGLISLEIPREDNFFLINKHLRAFLSRASKFSKLLQVWLSLYRYHTKDSSCSTAMLFTTRGAPA